MDSSAVSARLIGAIFVEKGLITEEQLALALEQQRASGDRLGEILVEHFGIERLDLAAALAEQWAEYERQGTAEERESHAETRDLVAVSDEWRGSDPSTPSPSPSPSAKRPIGEIFIERGLVTDDQLEEALEQQKTSGTRLGEILVASGKLSRLELASALADQWANFQKLRPPSEAPPAESSVSPPSPAGPPLPTPEVVPSAEAPVPATSSEFAGRLDALAARVDQLATDKSDWKPQLEKISELLRARMEHLEDTVNRRQESISEGVPDQGADGLRAEIGALAARIEAIPTQTHDWRYELSQVANDLRTRLERVENSLDDAPATEQLAELRAALEGLSARIDTFPPPSDEWRAAVAELAGRIDSLPAPSDEWREAIASLQTRIAEAAQAAGRSWELRASLDALVERVDSLPVPSQEWRQPLADLGARIDAFPVPSEEWRYVVSDLASRIDELTTRDWHSEVEQGAEGLRNRIERIEEGMSGQARAATVTEIAEQVHELARKIADTDAVEARLHALVSRVEALPVSSEEWQEQIAALAARFDSLPVSSEEWRDEIGALTARVDALRTDEWRTELAQVTESLRTRVERVEHEIGGSHGEQLESLRSGLEGLAARIEATPAPADEIRTELAGLAETLHGRLGQVEHRLSHEVRSEDLDGLSARMDEIAAKVEESSGVESRLQESLSALVDELAVVSERSVGSTAVGELRSAIERHDSRIEGFGGELAAFERRADEKAAGRSAELGALRARLETVESALAQTGGWSEAVDGAHARIESLEAHLQEFAASEAVERNAEIEDLRGQLVERVDALEKAQVKRKDVRELRDSVERVERRVQERSAQDEAAVRATEEAVREGIASLGERLSASGDAYLDTGRELSRSIAGLGLALNAAEAHGSDAPRSTDRPAEISVFLAFAPTAEGYRLVECAGSPPALEDEVNIEDCDGQLVVTRIGASPLPFDVRPCVYLERVH